MEKKKLDHKLAMTRHFSDIILFSENPFHTFKEHWSCNFLNEVLLCTAKQMVMSMRKLGHFAAQTPYLCAMAAEIT